MYLSFTSQYINSTLEMTELTIALHSVTNWLRANRLSLNKSKSNLLLFNVGNKPQTKFEIFVDDHGHFKQKEYAKYPGIFIDIKLLCLKHIQTTNLKISKGIVVDKM